MARVLIDSLNINYVVSGRGPPLLFVHGYTDSSRLWMQEVDFFSREYKSIAVDLVGHGNSDAREGGYSISDLSRDVFRFLQKMNIKRTILLGHSMGGMVAQQFCIDHPDEVQALVLCSTGASGRALKEAGGFDCLAMLKDITELGLSQSVENGVTYLLGKNTGIEVTDLVLSVESKTNLNAALGCLRGMWGWSMEGQLSHIAAPTLIIVGQEDRATPIACSEHLKRLIVGSQMKTISGCGHMLSVENPRELNMIVQEFLRTVNLG